MASGANIVLSRLAIGDLGTQYFADRGIFCAGRVDEGDLQRVAKATGARTQTTVNNLDVAALGSCAAFEEPQVGDAVCFCLGGGRGDDVGQQRHAG